MELRALGASTLVAACLAGLAVVTSWGLGAAPREPVAELGVRSFGPPEAALVVSTSTSDATPLADDPVRRDDPSPSATAPTRRLLVLHGACMTPASTFDRLEPALPPDLERAAPIGNARCSDGSSDWVGTGSEKAAALEAHLAAAPERGNVLVGFSRGAFVARDVALASPERFSGLVFIGASMKLDVDALRAAGVRRVVLASGELDSAHGSMRRNRDALERGGIEARFVSLGRVYHTLPGDTGERLRAALAWVAEEPPRS
jgi:pimeloyl-ACP methyl ester carboxylesterase